MVMESTCTNVPIDEYVERAINIRDKGLVELAPIVIGRRPPAPQKSKRPRRKR